MIRTGRPRGGFRGVCGALITLGAAAVAWGQVLSTPTFTNSSNPNELSAGSASVPSFERETGVGIVSSAGGGFVTRFTALVTADGDGGPGAGLGESLFADNQVLFTATAPGAYRLTIETAMRGDLHLVADGANGGTADIGAVTGFSTGGTVVAGGLGLPDAGIVGGSSGASSTVDESNSATIFGVSNGAAVAHTLRFQWSNAASTDATPGDEAAVRLGATSDVATETAGDYPGNPARTQADDGHFVTVTIESLCGNGTLDAGPSYAEACDEGPDNGAPSSCCTATCTFKTDGSSCDDGNACTLSDACTAGTCGSTSVQVCPLCQTCDSMGGCQIGPRTACKIPTAPLRSVLQFKDRTPDDGDQVVFKWSKGEATQTADFGDPLTTDAYALCVFNGGGNLLFKSNAPAGDVCGTKPCWKALSIKGFSYKDPLRTPEGADKISLKAGLQGKAKTQFKGKGDNLDPFALPLVLPVTAQLQAANGQCWEATFSAAGSKKNDGMQFKGKSD
jgi:hypothetical protein